MTGQGQRKREPIRLYWKASGGSWLASVTPWPKRGDPPTSAHPTAAARRLCKQLLAIGGRTAKVHGGREDSIIARGEEIRAHVLLKIVDPDYYDRMRQPLFNDPHRYQLHYGYALNEDGEWRFHEWLLDTRGRIIEKHTKHVAYFGIHVESPPPKFGRTRARP